MKLNNLILTSFIALALGACSNAGEEIANNDSKAGNGTLTFSIGLNNSASSRAGEVDGDFNEGNEDESTVSSITLKIVNKANSSVDRTLVYDDITSQFNAARDKDSHATRYTLKSPISGLSSGEKILYVTVNGTDDNTVSNANSDIAILPISSYSTLDALNTTISAPKHFKMTGKNTVTVVDNTTVTGVVSVDRVVAKIDEQSKQTFTITESTTAENSTLNVFDAANKTTTKTALTISLLSYSFLNLSQSYYNLKQSPFAVPADRTYLLSCPWGNQDDVFNYPTTEGQFKSFTNANTQGTSNGFTYCLENIEQHVDAVAATDTKEAVPAYDGYQTCVVYKAQINNYGADCYLVKKGDKNVFYTSFVDMDADNNNVYSRAYGYSPSTTAKDFAKVGVKKFANGICYYVSPIRATVGSTKTARIIRNNWYILTVKSIKGLGATRVNPKTPTDATLLDLQVLVKDWTYQVNDLEF